MDTLMLLLGRWMVNGQWIFFVLLWDFMDECELIDAWEDEYIDGWMIPLF